jgi:WD40 repeat protein/tRNA A-37 threonylcarbamoyl transferase component Bud32
MGSIQGGAATPAATADEPLREGSGTVIGPYQLLQKLGEGGMGAVYLAEQQQPVQRRVALKIIKAGLDSAHVIARFEAERQALALMDHPHIAKVLDAGATEAGRPFFVMELVKGIPLTKFCDQERLTLKERLELFIPVCQAVQHAHTKGIIHRDLKPSNVLVTLYDGKPVPKVIDFGVAKATAQKLTERTIFTEVGQIIGTLEYMAPEQAELNNLDIDTRADIYSLGVLLYELLTGSPPFTGKQLRSAAFTEMLRLIREVEPPKPSTKLSGSEELPSIAAKRKLEPARLTRLVQGELDWIVMKALEKERTRRYETANGLARDVERYLADEPVEACPPGAGYRLRKFARRYKKFLATTAAFLALLVVGATVSTWLAVWALAAERNARAQRDAARDAQADAQEWAHAEQDARIVEGKARQAADAQAAAVRNQICRYAVANGLRLANERDPFAALLWFAEPLIHDPGNRQEEEVTRQRLTAYRRYTPNPTLTQLWLWEKPRVEHAAFSPDGRWVGMAVGETARIWDVATSQPIGPPLIHEVSLRYLEFSPDGRKLLTVGSDLKSQTGEARVWDVLTGQSVGPPIKHREPFRQGTFSPDGQQVLLTSTDAQAEKGKAQVWDLATGQPIGSPLAHAGFLTVATFSPDGRWVLTASRDNTARVWDAQTGKPISPPLAHDKAPQGVAYWVVHAMFSPDGRWVLTGSFDQTARLWEAATGQLLYSLKPQGFLTHASFSPDGRLVRTIADLKNQSEIHLWDAAAGQPVGPVVRCQDRNGYALFSPDGRWLAGVNEKTVQLWEVATGQPVGPALHHHIPVRKLAFSPDGSRLLTVGYDNHSLVGEARLWTLARGELASVSHNHSRMRPGEFSPDGRWVLVVLDAKTVQTLEAATGRPVSPPLQHSEAVKFATFSPDGRWVGTVGGSTAQVWEPNTGQRLSATPPQAGALGFLAFSADSRRFLTAPARPLRRIGESASDKPDEIRVWETATGQPVGPALQVAPQYKSAALSPDGSRLVTAAGPPPGRSKPPPGGWPVQIWDVAQGKELYDLRQGPGVSQVAFSPDGRWVLTAVLILDKREVVLWDAATGKRIHTLSNPESYGVTLVLDGDQAAFSPDSRWVVTLDEVRIARVWEVATGRPVSLLQHQDAVNRAAFSPDSRRVVTISGNNVQVWEAATGQPISPPLLHENGVSRASFSLDGRWVLTRSGQTVRLWDLSPDSRPTADLIRHAQLLRARRLDQAGGYKPPTTSELQDAWQTLRAKYPQDFIVTPNQILEWHRREAEACVREKNAAAAVFHYLHGGGDWLPNTWMLP